MDTNKANNNTTMRSKGLAEMLPELTALLSENILLSTAKKQPKNRSTMAVTGTAEKFKPLTIAELFTFADIKAVCGNSAKRKPAQTAPGPTTTSAMKKRWNSSVKVDKRISHTKDGQMKHNPVRKVLNFQSKPQQSVSNTRATMAPVNHETPKFPKPMARAKKALHQSQAKNTVRISGVYKIPETPLETKPVAKSRLTIANKENNNPKAAPRQPLYNHVDRKIPPSPKPVPKTRKIILPIPDTPMFNDSWKSSCDASFLQKEQDINDIEEKAKAIPEESILSNLEEVSPPISTPFKEYRNVKEYFNNSSDMENSVNDTIKCFERPSSLEEVGKREESVIMSLCDMFNKATVMHSAKGKSELDILFEIKMETENNMKTQMKLLKSQMKLLNYINKLIYKKRTGSQSPISLEKTLTEESLLSKITKVNDKTPEKSPILRCTVIKSPAKSPSYTIPKKTPCLRKKVFHKSMPDMPTGMHTPKANIDRDNRAIIMYMKMKEQMNFLNTPVVKQRPISGVPDTPALTSHNLQSQLDKLFNNS